MKKYITLIAAGLALAFTGLHAQVTDESVAEYWSQRPDHPNNSETSWNEYWGYFRDDPTALKILDHLDANGLASVKVNPGLLTHLLYANQTHSSVASLTEKIHDDGLWKPGQWGYRIVRDVLINQHESYSVPDFVGKGFADNRWKAKLKSYVMELPTQEAIEVLQKEKTGLVFFVARNRAQDQWLTEVSADLMALKLDQ